MVGVGGRCGLSRKPLWLRQEATAVRARDCSSLKFKKMNLETTRQEGRLGDTI